MSTNVIYQLTSVISAMTLQMEGQVNEIEQLKKKVAEQQQQIKKLTDELEVAVKTPKSRKQTYVYSNVKKRGMLFAFSCQKKAVDFLLSDFENETEETIDRIKKNIALNGCDKESGICLDVIEVPYKFSDEEDPRLEKYVKPVKLAPREPVKSRFPKTPSWVRPGVKALHDEHSGTIMELSGAGFVRFKYDDPKRNTEKSGTLVPVNHCTQL